MFVLFFFLRDWPSTLMVSLSIPICLVITLGCMYFFGITLNVLSMMGLLLAVGMLVDNAVVVVESIYQYREKYPDKPWYSAVQGTQVVGIAIAAGTLTSIIVFLPNIFGEANDISIFLAQVAIAMSIAHLASWLVAVSLVPMLSAKLPPPKFIGRENAITRLRERYGRFVTWTLAHRRWTMAGVIALLVLSFIPIALTKKDMFDSGESRRLYLRYELNANYRLQDLKPAVAQVENVPGEESRALRNQVDVHVLHRAGRGDHVDPAHRSRQGQAPAPNDDQGRDAQGIAGARGRQGQLRFPATATGGGVDLALIGDSMDQLRELAPTVVSVLSRLPTLQGRAYRKGQRRSRSRDARRSRSAPRTTASMRRRRRATTSQIALRGMPLKDFHAGDRQLPVWLRFQGADTQSLAGLARLQVARARRHADPAAVADARATHATRRRRSSASTA